MTRGGRVCFFGTVCNRRLADCVLRRLCTRMSQHDLDKMPLIAGSWQVLSSCPPIPVQPHFTPWSAAKLTVPLDGIFQLTEFLREANGDRCLRAFG